MRAGVCSVAGRGGARIRSKLSPQADKTGTSIKPELACLLWRDSGLSHDIAPALQIALHPLRQRLGFPWLDSCAAALKALDNVRLAQYLIERPIEAFNDGGG